MGSLRLIKTVRIRHSEKSTFRPELLVNYLELLVNCMTVTFSTTSVTFSGTRVTFSRTKGAFWSRVPVIRTPNMASSRTYSLFGFSSTTVHWLPATPPGKGAINSQAVKVSGVSHANSFWWGPTAQLLNFTVKICPARNHAIHRAIVSNDSFMRLPVSRTSLSVPRQTATTAVLTPKHRAISRARKNSRFDRCKESHSIIPQLSWPLGDNTKFTF